VSTHSVFAAAPAFCPHIGGKPGGKVDPSVSVDKEDLAGAAIDRGGISRPFERRLRAITPSPGLSLWQTILVRGTGLCKPKDPGATATADAIDCSDAERSALGSAQIALEEFLTQSDVFVLTSPGYDRDAERFFKDPGRRLACVAPAPLPAAVTAGGAELPSDPEAGSDHFALTNFRVRGSAADLIYERGSSGYASADKATLEFGDDRDAGKRTTKFVGSLGYALLLDDYQTTNKDHVFFGLVPYFGINLDTSKADKQPKNVSSDVLEFGSVVEYRRASTFGTSYAPFVSYASATPRLLFNRDDKSELFGFDLLYRPTFKLLNSLRPIAPNSVIYWNVIGDIRLNNGIWLRRGERDADASRDFSRLGGRMGLGFATKGGPIPAELTISDTYLVTLAGKPSHLSLFKSDLSLYFNEDKNFGIDVAYSRGRFQDLESRVAAWTVGFAVKY